MSEPTAKRKRPATRTAPNTRNVDWDHHKQELTHLYIAENWTVNQISAFMRERHKFFATIQQYQKKLRSWKLKKYSDEPSWMVLSQALKRYGITLDDLEGPHPMFKVLHNGQSWPPSRVKKAIYRYDTSLLSTNTLTDGTELEQTDKLDIILRNLITRCVLRHHDLILKGRVRTFKALVRLILGVMHTNDLSKRLSDHNTSWSLRHGREYRLTGDLSLDEQLTFISCMLSISNDQSGATFFRDRDKTELTDEFRSLLQSRDRKLSNLLPTHLRQQYVATTYDRLLTDLLYFTLTVCILGDISSEPVLLTAAEVSQILGLSSSTSDPYRGHLLTVLLWSLAYHGKASLCAQLISGGADAKQIADGCICDDVSCNPQRGLTILQMTLMPRISERPKLDQVIAVLLEAGVDPNCCGNHGHIQPGRPTCCAWSPIYLALGHSSKVFSALLDAGAYLSAQMDLTEIISDIENPDVLSILLQKGVNPQRVHVSSLYDGHIYSQYICPLQVAMAKGRLSVALELLKHVAHPLGCPPANIAEIFDRFWTCHAPKDWCSYFVLETPLAWALIRGWYHLADQLIKSGASLMESYLDYHSTSSLDRLKEYLSYCSIETIFEIASAAPLQLAVWSKTSDAVEHILKAGVNPNHLYNIGFSPLTIALYKEHDDHIALLREWGAGVLLEDLRRLLEWGLEEVELETGWVVPETDRLLNLSKQYYLDMNVDPSDLGLTVPEQYSSEAEKCVRSWGKL